VDALRSIGPSQDLRGHYRAGHLVIGVKGALPGTEVERNGEGLLEAQLGTPSDRAAIAVRHFTLR
jgi:hypothetical protein